MSDDLTPAVSRALDDAQAFAHAAGASHVLPIHLARGLLAEEEGRAASLSIAAGLDLAAYYAAAPPEPESPPGSLPLAPLAQSALYEARTLARALTGQSTISSEALLLALLRADGDLVATLTGFGLRLDRLEAAVERGRPTAPGLEEPLRLGDVTERVDSARVLDAAGNRTREALRVVEDYCRFVLDDALLSRELKELRHGLAGVLGDLAAQDLLLEARETRRDVGVSIGTDDERQRGGLVDVVRANCKRLQEGLRTLEEVAKVHSPGLAQELESMRYRTYTLERVLLLGASARQRLAEARLHVLLGGSSCIAALDWTIAEVAAGGASVVQLREKALPDRELLARARQVRQWTRKAGVLFIVNDRPDIARLADADGVHLGQDDLPVKEARRILGPDALIGVSTHSLDQLRLAVLDGASYLGVGPVFPSETKPFEEFPGEAFVRAAHAETTLPLFAIGGINQATIDRAVAAGARRVAVSAAIAQAEEPRQTAAALLSALAGSPKR
jgi:thiamine-phosphate pyrophosphorylase